MRVARELNLTWRSTQTRKEAKEDPDKCYPIRVRSTGVSTPCHTNILQAAEHSAACKQNTADTCGFAIELLRQAMA